MKEELFVIVLHYGEVRLTQKCINSILSSKISNSILVVDNNSNFKSSKFNGIVKVIKNKNNLGYAGGMNVGITYFLSHGGSYCLLLNNDTTTDMNGFYELQNFLRENKDIGIVGPAVAFLNKGKMVYDIGGKINNWFGKTSHSEVNVITDKLPHNVDYISGCCMIIKRELFEGVGLFDERFFLYYEDVDFCLRAKKAGFKTYVYPAKKVNHYLSGSVGKNSGLAVYHQTLSAVLFGKKYFYGVKRALSVLFIFAQSLYIFIKNPAVGKYAFSGLFYGLYKRSN